MGPRKIFINSLGAPHVTTYRPTDRVEAGEEGHHHWRLYDLPMLFLFVVGTSSFM